MANLTNTGFIPVSAQTSLTQTQQIFKNVFGEGVNLNPAGAVGIFIQELANLNIDVNSIQTLLYGGLYNPDIASGVFLDSICALLDLKRIPAIASFATCEVTGLIGTVIPVGAQILNENGYVFELINAPITISGNPTLDTGVFSAVDIGLPISVGANSLNRIVLQIPGWDSVNNPTDGIVGSPKQTDTSLRYTRKQALAINSTNTIQSLISACQNELMPNIISDFIVLQNNTATTAIINGVSIPAYSIYLSVVQVGSSNDISAVLYQKKPPGVPMAGSYTPPLYTDPIYNWVTFQARWQQATVKNVVIAINITDIGYPVGTSARIKAAVLNAFNNGTVANPPITMRSGTIYANQFISVITELGVTTVISITITTTSAATPGATLTLNADQAPQLQLSNITITGL